MPVYCSIVAALFMLLGVINNAAAVDAYLISETYLQSLASERKVPAEVITKLTTMQGQAFADKAAFTAALEQALGAKILNKLVGKKQKLRTKLVRFADTRINGELKASGDIVIPLKFALGDAKYAELIAANDNSYIGNLKCRVCHREFFIGRKKDVHVKAFRLNISKHLSKEKRCLNCHTTGYGVPSGFTSVKKTRKLRDVTCEGCHGPGSKHKDLGDKGGLPAGTDKPETLKKMCAACHNERWGHSFSNLDAAYDAYRQAETNANKKSK